MAAISRLLALGLGLALFVGCEQQGPEAGEKVDKAVEDAGKAIEKAGEKAGEKLDEAAKKVRDATK